MTMTDRAVAIGTILESVVTLSRALSSPRTTPFGDAVLTRTQLDILFLLAHADEPFTPGRLSSSLKLTPGAITQTMDQLRDQRLVEQSASPRDGRVRVWHLTDAAAAQVLEFESVAIARTAPWFASFSSDELDALAVLIKRVEVA
ncbi:MarR family transcriptional regulator [Planococcus sp. APC 4015]|nr:MarR family transcriptional regulator [Planococcus sp. APC 4015]